MSKIQPACIDTNNVLGCLKIHLHHKESCSKNNAHLYSVYLYKILGAGNLKQATLGERMHGQCLPPEFFNSDNLTNCLCIYQL